MSTPGPTPEVVEASLARDLAALERRGVKRASLERIAAAASKIARRPAQL